MTTENQSSEPKPMVEILREMMERAKKLLDKQQSARLAVHMLTNMVRSQLTKIYGKDAPQVATFPPMPTNIPDNLVQDDLRKRVAHVGRLLEELASLPAVATTEHGGNLIFIGHGRSPLWRELKDFISDRLHLPWDEFNREAVAGYTTTERLQTMMCHAAFAFLVLTSEEEHADATFHARSNVIHEVGLFQGYLGLHRAVILLEEGCSEFSNIAGLSEIRFPLGDISARFEEVRRVLEREGLLKAQHPPSR